jgi:hypothetical protein
LDWAWGNNDINLPRIHQLCNTLSTSLYCYLFYSERKQKCRFFLCVYMKICWRMYLGFNVKKMWAGWHWTTIKPLPLFQYIHSRMEILVSWNICTSIREHSVWQSGTYSSLTLWCQTSCIHNVHCDAQNVKLQLNLKANYGCSYEAHI